MTFTELIARVTHSDLPPRICCDSRQVGPGDAFVAIKGVQVDGHEFIPQAVKQGARYIICSEPVSLPEGIEMIPVQDTSQALGLLAQARYGSPNTQLTNLAVTGTNGKTTVAYLVRSILNTAGLKCGLIGTIEYDTVDQIAPGPLTTPDPLTIAAAARKMVDAGAQFMVIEASSHALDQNRLAGISFSAAAFTNLSGDHLDYHQNEEQYLLAKKRLFTSLPVHALAVLNAESDAAHQIADNLSQRILWYAARQPADITAHIRSMRADGSDYSLIFGDVMEKVLSPLPGLHNISNHLAAAGLCLAAGLDLPTVVRGLSALRFVPGRLEPVQSARADEKGIRILVDYAHTDDALKNVLQTLQPLCEGRLIVVFGCGGDRDKTKRPRMAAVAESLADQIYVTSDNPRTEDPERIIQNILQGFTDPGAPHIHVQTDRSGSIRSALQDARSGDLILIAGKGHETYQIIGTEKQFFSDFDEVKRHLEELS